MQTVYKNLCRQYYGLSSLTKLSGISWKKMVTFLLMHSVGSIPHGTEIDVPLNYADYYFLEALKRKRDIEEGTH